VAALDDQSLANGSEEVLSQTQNGGPSTTKNPNAETKAPVEEPIQDSEESATSVGSTSDALQEEKGDSPSTSASHRSG